MSSSADSHRRPQMRRVSSATASMTLRPGNVLTPRLVRPLNRAVAAYTAAVSGESDAAPRLLLPAPPAVKHAVPRVAVSGFAGDPISDLMEAAEAATPGSASVPGFSSQAAVRSGNKLRQKMLEIQRLCEHFLHSADIALLDMTSMYDVEDETTRTEIMRMLEGAGVEDPGDAIRPALRTSAVLEMLLKSTLEMGQKAFASRGSVDEGSPKKVVRVQTSGGDDDSCLRMPTPTMGPADDSFFAASASRRSDASLEISVKVPQSSSTEAPAATSQRAEARNRPALLNSILLAPEAVSQRASVSCHSSSPLSPQTALATDYPVAPLPFNAMMSPTYALLLDAHVALHHVLTMSNPRVVPAVVANAKTSIPTVFKAVRAMCNQAILKLHNAKDVVTKMEQELAAARFKQPQAQGDMEQQQQQQAPQASDLWTATKRLRQLGGGDDSKAFASSVSFAPSGVFSGSIKEALSAATGQPEDHEFVLTIAVDHVTSLAEGMSSASWRAARNILRNLIRGTMPRTHGRVLHGDATGTRYMLSFPTALEALVYERCVQQYCMSLPWPEAVAHCPLSATVLPNQVRGHPMPVAPEAAPTNSAKDEQTMKLRRVATEMDEAFSTYTQSIRMAPKIGPMKVSGGTPSSSLAPSPAANTRAKSFRNGSTRDSPAKGLQMMDSAVGNAARLVLFADCDTGSDDELFLADSDGFFALPAATAKSEGPPVPGVWSAKAAVALQSDESGIDTVAGDKKRMLGEQVATFRGLRIATSLHYGSSSAAFQANRIGVNSFFATAASLVSFARPGECVVSVAAFQKISDLLPKLNGAASLFDIAPPVAPPVATPAPTSATTAEAAQGSFRAFDEPQQQRATDAPAALPMRFATKMQRYAVRELKLFVAHSVVWRAIRGREAFLLCHATPIQEYDCRWWLPSFFRAPASAPRLVSRACGCDPPACDEIPSATSPRVRRRSTKALKQGEASDPEPEKKAAPPSPKSGLSGSPPKIDQAKKKPPPLLQVHASTPLKATPMGSRSPMTPHFAVPATGAVGGSEGSAVAVEQAERASQTDMFHPLLASDADVAGEASEHEALCRFLVSSAAAFRGWLDGAIPSEKLLQHLSDEVGLGPQYDPTSPQADTQASAVEARGVEWEDLSEHCRAITASASSLLTVASRRQLNGALLVDGLAARASVCASIAAASEALDELHRTRRRKAAALTAEKTAGRKESAVV
jgi:hypothetical protein